MEIYEITGYRTGVSREGVNYLQPSDSFQNIEDGFVHRQILQSRRGFNRFGSGPLSDGTRVTGIYEWTKQDNSTELLAFSKDYLYTYNSTTRDWDQVANNGSAPATFGLTENYYYISGVSYPSVAGANRFVFCSRGLSDVLVYDGTDVRSFTLDNGDYVAPSEGALTAAWQVFNFNGRINFWNPTLGGTTYPQGMLYSGIRIDGNGDSFTATGSGIIYANTSNYFQGAEILGDTMIAAFNRTFWALEITTDVFNPYTIRRIASVIGSNAYESLVSWDDKVYAVGLTGFVSTDAREAKRFDNLIPYFTENEIQASNSTPTEGQFDLTYGGFDRVNGQFLWSYLDSGSDLVTQNRVIVHNYEEASWSVYNARFSVFGESQALVGGINWDDLDGDIDPSWAQFDTTEDIWNSWGAGGFQQRSLAGDDKGFVWQLNQDADDYFFPVNGGITKASSAVITLGAHPFLVGDEVVVSLVEGMTEINNFDPGSPSTDFVTYEVTAVTTTTITVNVDSTDFTTYTGSGYVSKPIAFRAETVPFNPYRSNGRRVHVSHVEILLDSFTGFAYFDVLLDEEKTPFKMGVLMEPSTEIKARQWITVTINQEADFFTFVMRQDSPYSQVKITNMRIHCRPGGLTSG